MTSAQLSQLSLTLSLPPSLLVCLPFSPFVRSSALSAPTASIRFHCLISLSILPTSVLIDLIYHIPTSLPSHWNTLVAVCNRRALHNFLFSSYHADFGNSLVCVPIISSPLLLLARATVRLFQPFVQSTRWFPHKCCALIQNLQITSLKTVHTVSRSPGRSRR